MSHLFQDSGWHCSGCKVGLWFNSPDVSSCLSSTAPSPLSLPLPPSPRLPILLFEGELVGEVREEVKRSEPPRPSLTARPLLPVFTGHLQLDGHQHPICTLAPSSPHPLCLSDYGSLLLLRLGLRHRLAHGLEQPAGEPAPAPPRILFLILA